MCVDVTRSLIELRLITNSWMLNVPLCILIVVRNVCALLFNRVASCLFSLPFALIIFSLTLSYFTLSLSLLFYPLSLSLSLSLSLLPYLSPSSILPSFLTFSCHNCPACLVDCVRLERDCELLRHRGGWEGQQGRMLSLYRPQAGSLHGQRQVCFLERRHL